MVSRTAIYTVMERAVRKAARGLVRDFGEVEHLQVSVKGPGDFVSNADRNSERILREELERARPGYGFLMEEGGEIAGDGTNRWIIDPLDGTTNFLHGIPQFCISVALERSGEVVAGIVYNPIQDELYWAERGHGAFLNERRLRVSGRRNLEDALIGTGIPFGDRGDHAVYLRTLAAVMNRTAGTRRAGAAALDLAYVAAGRLDGFWEFGLHPWDIAAGMILIREAGGFVEDLGGRENPMKTGNVLAANSHLLGPLGRLLRSATDGPGAA
ncbi:MAG: inositol monophosphatase [Alphaproteobacteria bacterium]|nr:inositol monophosphatase [Alphaproteobacteria bacterium]